LDEEVNTKKSVPAFSFCLKRFSKEEVPGIKEKKLSPFLFHLENKSGFLGHTAKRVSESPTRLDLTHHIVGVNDAELDFGGGPEERVMEWVQKKSRKKKEKQLFGFQ
jgi:hypothetical protein